MRLFAGNLPIRLSRCIRFRTLLTAINAEKRRLAELLRLSHLGAFFDSAEQCPRRTLSSEICAATDYSINDADIGPAIPTACQRSCHIVGDFVGRAAFLPRALE
jgi:hypothetical protein